MGFGDEILGSGLARGALARGRRVAFGDGKRIIWSAQAHEIYANNPNVAPPGSEGARDLEWVPHYRGNRLYARSVNGRWQWNSSFRATRGELFFTEAELNQIQVEPGFVLIEPSVKNSAPNKQWPVERYQALARQLLDAGYRVAQFSVSRPHLAPEVIVYPSLRFRTALLYLRRAALYIGPEGGLHHAAAALGIPAVVIFGGFISPQTTGYDIHTNLFTGSVPCGTMGLRCLHCINAMKAISVSMVCSAAMEILRHGKVKAS